MSAAPQPLLRLRGLVKRFGGLLVTDHVDLDIEQGEIHAVIGPNGAGKTTLINQIAGELKSVLRRCSIASMKSSGWSGWKPTAIVRPPCSPTASSV